MFPKPLSPYFLIKIPRKDQEQRKGKIGKIYLHFGEVFMTRNMQHGEIVDIGIDAHDTFPEAQIGDMLICHHFVESDGWEKGDDNKHMVFQDEDFNYYNVTCFSYNGKRNEAYGVFNGKEIIPNPEYIFLDKRQPTESDLPPQEFQVPGLPDFVTNKPFAVSEGGLVVAKNWKPTRAELIERQMQLKEQISNLSKTTQITESLKSAIENRERELQKISQQINAKKYELYHLAAINPEFQKEVKNVFGIELQKGSEIYMRSDACETTIDFNEKTYIMAKTDFFGIPKEWGVSAVKEAALI